MEFTEALQYLLLGLFQGFTEPIPISSSGHLVIAQHIFGLEIKGLHFELLMNTASLLAVMYIFKESIFSLSRGFFTYLKTREQAAKGDFLFVVYLIVATIPAGLIGLLFQEEIGLYFKSVKTIGIALLATAIALFVIRKMKGNKGDKAISLKDAFLVGMAQVAALIPGVSRSGSTVVAAMLLGMKQETALKFSFLLYIPISAAGFALGVSEFIGSGEVQSMFFPYLLAFLASFGMTVFSLRWFINVMQKGKLIYFSAYCLIAGTAVLLFL